MKKRVVAILMATVVAVGSLAGCGSKGGNGGEASTEEGKVINIYSWNDEFRERLEAIYPEVESTSKDGTVTTLKDGTEIHWIINPNQDGVYQQKLDEALMKQADVDTDDKVDIFLSETDYVYKYTDAEADTAVPLKDLGIDPDKDLADQYDFTKQQHLMQTGFREDLHGSAAREQWFTVVILQKRYSEQTIRLL